MGRASRQSIRDTVEFRHSPGNWSLATKRLFAQSPLAGGERESPFTAHLCKGETLAPSVVPQGPPLLEDGEENPEATLLSDMALGQIGEDLQGNSFQLLRASQEFPPRRVMLRCMETGEVFWRDTRIEPTVLFDSVSYGNLQDDDLRRYAQWHNKSSAEDGVWLMREEGLFDMQVVDHGERITLIGNWTLKETLTPSDEINREAHRFTDARVARASVEFRAQAVESYSQIDSFRKQMMQRSLPAPQSDEERLEIKLRSALLGKGSLASAADALEEAARGRSDAVADYMLNLSLDLLELHPLPRWGDRDYLRRVFPFWKRITELRRKLLA